MQLGHISQVCTTKVKGRVLLPGLFALEEYPKEENMATQTRPRGAAATVERDLERRTEIDRIKASNDIATLASTVCGVSLNGSDGSPTRQGICPFPAHKEKNASFTIYGRNQSFYCFGCQRGGDVIALLRHMSDPPLPFAEAIERLGAASHTPVARPAQTQRPKPDPQPRDIPLLTAAAGFYARQLKAGDEKATRYLAKRGIQLADLPPLALGFANGSGLFDELKTFGTNKRRIYDSALISRRGDTEWFGDRIVVSNLTSNGQVNWMVGRPLDDTTEPRFKALPGDKPVLGLERLGPHPSWSIFGRPGRTRNFPPLARNFGGVLWVPRPRAEFPRELPPISDLVEGTPGVRGASL